MGLKAGQKQVVLAEVEILSNQIETLGDLTLDEVAAEGFGPGSHHAPKRGWTERDFGTFWADGHGYGSWPIWTLVPCRRISWRYLDLAHIGTNLDVERVARLTAFHLAGAI